MNVCYFADNTKFDYDCFLTLSELVVSPISDRQIGPSGSQLETERWTGRKLSYRMLAIRELEQQGRQRQRKRHFKINIWEMLTI